LSSDILVKNWRFAFVSCLSGARLVSAPVFIFLFVDPNARLPAVSIVLLAVMVLTDLVDGALARRWKVTSAFGYVLDGVADRSTNIALIVALTSLRALSPLLAFVLLLRDVLLYAARSLFSEWWKSNPAFRSSARITAAVFYVLVGGIAIIISVEKLGWIADELLWAVETRQLLVRGVWLLALWSYLLLAIQVRSYSQVSSETRP
jgi:cardiolipin synthase